MAQTIYCDQCEADSPAFIVVSFYNTPVTESVCLACLPQWIVDLSGAIKANLGEEVADSMVQAIVNARLEIDETPPEPEPTFPATRVTARNPGTARVVRSSHGRRKSRPGPIDEPPADDEIVS